MGTCEHCGQDIGEGEGLEVELSTEAVMACSESCADQLREDDRE